MQEMMEKRKQTGLCRNKIEVNWQTDHSVTKDHWQGISEEMGAEEGKIRL